MDRSRPLFRQIKNTRDVQHNARAQITSTTFRDAVLDKMVKMSSQDNYKNIANFEWYVTVLASLSRLENTTRGMCGAEIIPPPKINTCTPYTR
jgi:hypothetical protein